MKCRLTNSFSRRILWIVLAFECLAIQPAAAGGIFVTNTPMPVQRFGHVAALLLNDNVLVAGGSSTGHLAKCAPV